MAAVRRGIPATKAGWSLAGAAALVAMAFGFNDLYPEIAAERSRLIDARAEVEAARELARADDLQVALFGTLSEGTSFYMDDRGLRKFSKDQVTSLIALAQREPRLIVVATGSNASVFQQALPPTHQLIRASGRHFVFELVDRRSQQRRSVARGPAPQSR